MTNALAHLAVDVQAALRSDLTIDITTTGRRSGQPRRIEIWFLNVDDVIYITGTPGRRDWFANLQANPTLVKADLKRTAPRHTNHDQVRPG